MGSNVGLVRLNHGADPIFVQTQLWRTTEDCWYRCNKAVIINEARGVLRPSKQAHNRADGQYISVFYGTQPLPLHGNGSYPK